MNYGLLTNVDQQLIVNCANYNFVVERFFMTLMMETIDFVLTKDLQVAISW